MSLFFQRVSIRSPCTAEALRSQLRLATLPAPSPFCASVRSIPELLTNVNGKFFVGNVGARAFKVMLLGAVSPTIRIRRHYRAAIMVGTLDGAIVNVVLRVPWFTMGFTVFWCLTISAGFVFLLLGPANSAVLRLLFAGAFVLPLFIVRATFCPDASVFRWSTLDAGPWPVGLAGSQQVA